MTVAEQTEYRRKLTIGAVCAALRVEYPDISISKIRFLEDQGLVTPERTTGGYRQFTQEDVDRLRTILRLQRDEFLPLRVIRDEIERTKAGTQERPSRRRSGAAPVTDRGPRLAELLSASGSEEQFVRQLEEFGLVAAENGRYSTEDPQIVESCVRLSRYGLDARHLRAIFAAIQREAGMVEQVLSPALRSGNPDRVNAGLEDLVDLATVCADLTEAMMKRDLRRLTRTTPQPSADAGTS